MEPNNSKMQALKAPIAPADLSEIIPPGLKDCAIEFVTGCKYVSSTDS